jgi:hypothetical protein
MGNYDFYRDIIEVQKISGWIIHPPDYYIIKGIYLKILSLVFSYDLNNWSLDPSITPWFMPFFGILPEIIVFFVGGFLIYKIYPRKELLIGYLASPLAFISIEVMGQSDIYPAFFTLLALYFAKRSFDTTKSVWKIASIVSIGIGMEFKLYPLLLLFPISIFLSNKNFIQTLKYIFLGTIVGLAPWIGYLKWFKPLLLSEPSLLFNLQLAPVNLPPLHTISIWVVGYCVLLWGILKYVNISFRNLVGSVFLSCSWFFMSVYTNPQWWVWLLPSSIFVLGEFRDRIFSYLYVAMSLAYILYPMMWVNNVDIILRNYIPIIPITGNSSALVVSVIVSILLIWNLELLNTILKKEKQ